MPLELIATGTLIFAYLLGSVSTAIIVCQLLGLPDPRTGGSHNPGATNVLRLGGRKLGALTLLLDALKGAVPVLVARQVHMDYAAAAALGAFLGHLFPVWLGFRGGKGVAVAFGVAFGLSLPLGLVLCLVWLATAALSKYSSLAGLTAFALSAPAAWMLTGNARLTGIMLFITLLVFVRHHANIKRLLDGTESKINLKKSA